MVKQLILFLLGSVILTIIAFFIAFSPSYASSLNFQGHQVAIDRDSFGIPHIQAPTRRSFLYAWGNVISQDRLFQINFRKFYAQGRLSQFLGQVTLPNDIMMRDLGLAHIAGHIAEKMKKQDKEAYQDFEAFVQGINDEAARRFVLPLQFYMLGVKWENWTVAELYLNFKLLDFSTSFNFYDEYSRSLLLSNYSIEEVNKILPDTKEGWAFDSVTVAKNEELSAKFKKHDYTANSIFQPLQLSKIVSLGMPEVLLSSEGSNAWVVSGQHTQSGKPILSGDPHLDNIIPSNWYPIRATYQQAGKTFRFSGVANPGTPMAYGKTDYFALGVTTIYTDTQDLYKQKVEGNKYFVDGEWKNLKLRPQKILIKKGRSFRQHNHTVRMTHRGPILSCIVSMVGTYNLSSQTLSLAWAGFNEDYESLVTASRNIETTNFESAKEMLMNGLSFTPGFTIVAATVDNHILMRQTGANPIRPNYDSGNYVQDGTSTKNDWLGFMPPEDRVMVIDPKKGFIVASNNRLASQHIHGGYFKHSFFTARADRLEELISTQILSGRKITTQFAKTTLHDTVDVYCKRILPEIFKIIDNQHLLNFDCNFTRKSWQASMYEIFLLELWYLIKPQDTKASNLYATHQSRQFVFNYIHQAYQGDEVKQKNAKQAWNNMKLRLSKQFQTQNSTLWLWGNLHKDVMRHIPFGMHPFLSKLYSRQSQGWGNLHTLNVGKCYKMESDNFATSHRANFRSIYDFGGKSWWIIDGGVSQNLLSSHYDDQWKLFIAQQMLPVDISRQNSDEL